MEPFDLSGRTRESAAAALYRMGHSYASGRLKEGIRPDAIRAEMAMMADIAGHPFHAETDRGVEDALAGRPPSPAA